MSSGPVDVFVSFTGADVAWAEWVAAVAEQAGYTVRFQRWDFGAGSNFVTEMSAALADAERLVMVTSARYWQSVMATAEWTAAFARDPACLLPIRIEDVPPPALLAPIIHVDIFEVDEARARARLVEALRGLSRTAGSVAFPGGVAPWPAAPGVFEAPGQPAPLAGRDGTLAELRERLAGAEAVTLTQALAGPGGVGKTVLAAEYAWRYRSDYELVWWVASEQRSLILESLLRLAPRLGVPVPEDLEVLPKLVRQALEGFAERWLVVFDNAPDYEAIAPFLPGGGGHTLITSRNPGWGGRHATIDVECLDQATSAQYLLARAFGDAEPPQAERLVADELAVELGGLPLALAQASAYLDAYGESLTGYLELFREQRPRLLADAPTPLDYQGTVHTAVSLALARLDGEPAALALLELLAFLGPETIPLDLLLDNPGEVELPTDLAGLAGPGRRHERNVKGTGPLRAVSLINRDASGVKVHRLTQAVLRDQLEPQRQAERLGLAIALVTHALDLDADDPGTWPKFAALLPAAHTTANHTCASDALRVDGLSLLHRLGHYLFRRGDLAGARTLWEEVVAGRQEALGDHHHDTLRSINNLALVLHVQGDLTRARGMQEQILAMRRKMLGDHHPHTLHSINNLAITLYEQGDLISARALWEEALAAYREALGDHDPHTLHSMNNLTTTLARQGDLVGARAMQEAILAGYRETLGDRHPHTLLSINNLAYTLQEQGDVTGARTLHEEALAGYREVLGDRHVDTLRSIGNLAETLHEHGELANARMLYEEALTGRRGILGERHPHTMNAAWGLYCTLLDLDPPEASMVFERDLRWLLDEDPERLTADLFRIRDEIAERSPGQS